MLNIKLQNLEFSLLGFGLTLVQCALIPPFWNGNVYSVTLYVGSMCSASPFNFMGGLQLRDFFSLGSDFELWAFEQF